MIRLPGLELDILQLIKQVYNCEFNHNIEVWYSPAEYYTDPDTKITYLTAPEEYILKLHIHDNIWCPLTITCQCSTDQAFLDYIEKEFKTRNLIRSERYKIQLDGNHKSEKRIR